MNMKDKTPSPDDIPEKKKKKKVVSKDKGIDVGKVIASPYSLPPNLCNLLREHSLGFLLFSVDYNGNFQVNMNADNQILLRGLLQKINEITGMMIEQDQIQTGINMGILEEVDPDEDDDERGGF